MSSERGLLVLDETGIAVEQRAIATVEAASSDAPAPWLPALDAALRPAAERDRRVLALVDGRRFEVPARMHVAEPEQLLAPPALLRASMDALGLVGLATLASGLTLVCDPRRLAAPDRLAGGWA